jgi:lycopene cyclase domain-containing protein
MLTYLLVELCVFCITFILSFHPGIGFNRNWRAVWPAIALSSVFFILWDICFTGIGVWGFNKQYIIGVYLFNLPLEEWLFFICIPYATLFSYHCMRVLTRESALQRITGPAALVVTAALAAIALLNTHRVYTFSVCIAAAVLLLLQLFAIRNIRMSLFIVTLMFLFVPFSLTNGILTGSWLDTPVFWYDEQAILPVRLLTIPLEDLFYTMLLLLVNATLYEYFLMRAKRSVHAQR